MNKKKYTSIIITTFLLLFFTSCSDVFNRTESGDIVPPPANLEVTYTQIGTAAFGTLELEPAILVTWTYSPEYDYEFFHPQTGNIEMLKQVNPTQVGLNTYSVFNNTASAYVLYHQQSPADTVSLTAYRSFSGFTSATHNYGIKYGDSFSFELYAVNKNSNRSNPTTYSGIFPKKNTFSGKNEASVSTEAGKIIVNWKGQGNVDGAYITVSTQGGDTAGNIENKSKKESPIGSASYHVLDTEAYTVTIEFYTNENPAGTSTDDTADVATNPKSITFTAVRPSKPEAPADTKFYLNNIFDSSSNNYSSGLYSSTLDTPYNVAVNPVATITLEAGEYVKLNFQYGAHNEITNVILEQYNASNSLVKNLSSSGRLKYYGNRTLVYESYGNGGVVSRQYVLSAKALTNDSSFSFNVSKELILFKSDLPSKL